MPQGIPIGGSITSNERLWCSVDGCTGHRFKLQPYCCTHSERVKRTGDPRGFTPDPRQWRWERTAVADLFKVNPQHPGMVRALAYLTTWTTRATQEAAHGNHWQLEVARVMRHGVTVQDILVEVCAGWSWLQRMPHKAPSDRAAKFWLGHAVLKLAPRPVRMSARANLTGGKSYPLRPHWRALEDTGAHLLAVLAPLLVNVHQAIHAQEDSAQQVVADLRAPFLPSTKAIKAASINPVTSA